MLVLRGDECSSDFYVGRDDFFCIGKMLNFNLAQFNFSRFGLLLISFKGQFISYVKRRTNSIIEQQKYKGHKKLDPRLVSKVEFIFQIFQRNENFIY